ncbi:hypothetical protein [Parapedobacter indicus]|uniref:DUF4374 domain-containing protein n=1 Tax=Parapedobacter indicus TaxID=1477437 RepID=A0A1I3M7U2_9SPHI|nr:hypothetical protein [Parapedobacter indicus]PPL01259.1 hypothetical protein CLV26_10668 [Parapedobacter indicus]SFI92766.1 hypothetical protein SAMN05444682_106267 [Parapedobacter indicus]
MKKLFGFFLVADIVAITLGSCVRNDDEPVMPVRPISRLYISVGNYQTNASEDPIDNVLLIDPADTLEAEMDVVLSHNSEALRGGAGIYFDPFQSAIFQAGYGTADTTIRVMSVGALGILSNSGQIQYSGLNAMRGLTYHYPSKMLYVANNATVGGRTTIYGYHLPYNRRGYTLPDRVLRLDPTMRPWGMVLWGDSLLVSNSGTSGSVSLYGGLSKVDSLVADFQALSTIRIEGAAALRGIAFVDSLDILVAADYGTGSSDNPVADGRIYIIDGIKAKLKEGSFTTVAPTRTIQGALTGLTGPMDVAIDPRQGRRTIFVADYDAQVSGGQPGRILRFRLADDGNVAPEASVSLDTLGNARRPFGIYLDVRGVPNSQ